MRPHDSARVAVEQAMQYAHHALRATARGDAEAAANALQELSTRVKALQALPGGEALWRQVEARLHAANKSLLAKRPHVAARMLVDVVHAISYGLQAALARKQQRDAAALSR